jgi:RimJ/RimL family protein N-acetyltransferase
MLIGKLVCLVPYKKEYIPAYLKWGNDSEVGRYLMIYLPSTLEQLEERYKENMHNPNMILFSIVTCPSDQQGEKLIGGLGAEINWKDRNAEIGIMIGEKEFWGKGYGTDTMTLFTEYLFTTLNMNRVELSTFDFNIRAQKCYRKVGFVEEGKKRQDKYQDGKYHDVVIMGILRDEWDAAQMKKT